ncbi:hypothetical protein F3J29_05965 [Enterobacter sp. Cy-643]|uniref:hypothetical protein n=1 Tax=Enterobacter sp. Cy-643 TaxID=2608346 RepID=UPI0014245125|nr:hypothetical protein [Enterobacter sp. Cy-643]NIF31680.1 hypothetical protein [Enterobacter sp. Cy-643]
MPKKIENSYDLSTDKQYAAGRFTAATTDRETAASFDPHVVRVSGVATKIPNIFSNGNEHEYLFPADAVFDVRKMKDGDVHLKMSMNDRA